MSVRPLDREFHSRKAIDVDINGHFVPAIFVVVAVVVVAIVVVAIFSRLGLYRAS